MSLSVFAFFVLGYNNNFQFSCTGVPGPGNQIIVDLTKLLRQHFHIILAYKHVTCTHIFSIKCKQLLQKLFVCCHTNISTDSRKYSAANCMHGCIPNYGEYWALCFFHHCCFIYSRLSLSRTPRDSLKYFKISVLRDIRFAEFRKKKKINKSNNRISYMNMQFDSWR